MIARAHFAQPSSRDARSSLTCEIVIGVRAMGAIMLGFIGGFFGTYLGYKHEWPASSVLVFTAVGFLMGFGGGYLLTLRALKAL
jgi:hypothetical protein